jgi:hypothetical protein
MWGSTCMSQIGKYSYNLSEVGVLRIYMPDGRLLATFEGVCEDEVFDLMSETISNFNNLGEL